jgi:hypothetical protein
VIRVALVVWAGFAYGVLWAAIMFALTSFFGSVIWFGQLTVMIHLSIRRTLAAVWRTFAATAIMSAGVYYFMSIWPHGDTTPGRVAELILAMAIGGTLYIGPLLGLWVLCGRPAGPEDHAAKAIPKLLSRLGLGGEKPVIAG